MGHSSAYRANGRGSVPLIWLVVLLADLADALLDLTCGARGVGGA